MVFLKKISVPTIHLAEVIDRLYSSPEGIEIDEFDFKSDIEPNDVLY
jgi:hypothetical protein